MKWSLSFILLLLTIFILFLCLFKYTQYETFDTKLNISGFPSKNFFRIIQRTGTASNTNVKIGKSLQIVNQDINNVQFANIDPNFNDLWVLWNNNLYSLRYNVYLQYDVDNNKLITSTSSTNKNQWIFTKNGQMYWSQNNEKYCVPFQEDGLCPEYQIYIEQIIVPFQNQKILFTEKMEFSQKKSFKWTKVVEKEYKFENIEVKILGNPSAYKYVVSKKENLIEIQFDILQPTIIWLFVFGTKSLKKQIQRPKPKPTQKPIKKTPPVSEACPIPLRRNYNIEYHIQYPELVKKIVSKTASEFGIEDLETQKIYRCNDILTSPYYIQKFKHYE